jgi:hypothetical protein
MNKRLFGLIAILAATTLSVGCFESDDNDDNGSGGDVDCSFTACGGDVVGTWNSYGSCMSTTGYEQYPGCEDVVIDGAPDFTGSATFNADGSYTQDTTISGDVHEVFDDDCIASMTGGMMNGEAYCALVSAVASSGESGMSGSCTYSGGKCTCNLSIDMQDSQQGSYTLAGNTMTIDDGEAVEYCVSNGTELKIVQGDNEAVLVFRK